MWNEIDNNTKLQKVIISTGNILNVDSATLRKSNEELLESLKLCTECQKSGESQNSSDGATKATSVCDAKLEMEDNIAQILRGSQELDEKIKEFSRSELYIGTKLFLNKSSKQAIEEAVNVLIRVLKVQHVDSLVLAYHPAETAAKTLPPTPDASTAAFHSADIGWAKRNEYKMDELKGLWKFLEEFRRKKLICELGVADLDYDALKELHETATEPLLINQINLVKCCVVPPNLKEFCTQHDIQLLTHSDPEMIIDDEDFFIPNYTVDWSLRYQIHLRCRGVVAAKGYILQASKLQQTAASAM